MLRALVGRSAAPEIFEYATLRAAIAIFDKSGDGFLTAAQTLGILTLDRGDGTALSLQNGWKVIDRCAERDAATGKRVVKCDVLCKLLSSR